MDTSASNKHPKVMKLYFAAVALCLTGVKGFSGFGTRMLTPSGISSRGKTFGMAPRHIVVSRDNYLMT